MYATASRSEDDDGWVFVNMCTQQVFFVRDRRVKFNNDVVVQSTRSPSRSWKVPLLDKQIARPHTPTQTEPLSEASATESQRQSRSTERGDGEPKDKPKKDTDLISTATSALKRLNFRSAGGSHPKRAPAATATAANQNVPTVFLMGSSTTSETTTNTSTDSSNTVYTMVTVTDAEQDEKPPEQDLMENKGREDKPLVKAKEFYEPRRDMSDEDDEDKNEKIKRIEILSEFDELFLANEKRIQEEEKLKNKTRSNKNNNNNNSGIASLQGIGFGKTAMEEGAVGGVGGGGRVLAPTATVTSEGAVGGGGRVLAPTATVTSDGAVGGGRRVLAPTATVTSEGAVGGGGRVLAPTATVTSDGAVGGGRRVSAPTATVTSDGAVGGAGRVSAPTATVTSDGAVGGAGMNIRKDYYDHMFLSNTKIEDIVIREQFKNCSPGIALREKSKEYEAREQKCKNLMRACSTVERDGDDFFRSAENQSAYAPGGPPSTVTYPRDERYQSKRSVIDEESLINFDAVVENGNREPNQNVQTEKPRSSIRTIQSELPQRTFSSNFNKKKKEQEEASSSGLEKSSTHRHSSPKPGNRNKDDTVFPFPPRMGSPRHRSASPKKDGSSSLKKLTDISGSPKNMDYRLESPKRCTAHAMHTDFAVPRETEEIPRAKFDTILNLDSPPTTKGGADFNQLRGRGSSFDYPTCTSPTESIPRFDDGFDEEEERQQANAKRGNAVHIIENEVQGAMDRQDWLNYNRMKRQERKSVSLESPRRRPSEHEGRISQNPREVFGDKIPERNSPRNRKYSVLATDGSVKNFVSESATDFKRPPETMQKDNASGVSKNQASKGGGGGGGAECPQRHRRVSIIQGDSLRHFIFEEPETTRAKPKQRKVSKVMEDSTRDLLLEDVQDPKSNLVPVDQVGDESPRKSSIAPEEKPRKFSVNTLGDIVSARKFSLLPPGEIYTSQIDGKTTEIIKLAPGTKGKPLTTIVVQQASIQRGSISGPSGQKEEALLDVANSFTFEELHEFDMKYGSPHHCRSQSVKTPGRSCGRPNYLCLPQQRSRVASMPNTGVEEEYYRLRHFSITGKGIINRGDSFKSRRSRSNNSVASSNSSHSTEQIVTNVAAVGSYPGSARTSAECSLASSRESSTTSVPYRVLILGGAGVGKTSLISQLMTSEYLHAYDDSLDEEYGEQSVSVLLDGEESELIFIDHTSDEIVTENSLTFQPQAYIIVYSVVDRVSFQIAEEILQNLWRTDTIAVRAVILVANKTDLVRCRLVTSEEGKNMATSYECKFIETSVAINHNVDELLVGILSQIRLKLAQKPKRNKSPLGRCKTKDKDSPKKWKCKRLTASLKVKSLLNRVWSGDSKSKSCENLHVL